LSSGTPNEVDDLKDRERDGDVENQATEPAFTPVEIEVAGYVVHDRGAWLIRCFYGGSAFFRLRL
jgi:hypothetical protein